MVETKILVVAKEEEAAVPEKVDRAKEMAAEAKNRCQLIKSTASKVL